MLFILLILLLMSLVYCEQNEYFKNGDYDDYNLMYQNTKGLNVMPKYIDSNNKIPLVAPPNIYNQKAQETSTPGLYNYDFSNKGTPNTTTTLNKTNDNLFNYKLNNDDFDQKNNQDETIYNYTLKVNSEDPKYTKNVEKREALLSQDLLPGYVQNSKDTFQTFTYLFDDYQKAVAIDIPENKLGVDTIGQSKKNANQDLRVAPLCPKFGVGPWNGSTIEPDYNIKSLY